MAGWFDKGCGIGIIRAISALSKFIAKKKGS